MAEPDILGIDNVMFAVADFDTAIGFYEACGLKLEKRFDPPGIAVFGIGGETPGLVLRRGEGPAGRFWVEVRDAATTAKRLLAAGIPTTRVETQTGITVEARDASGNVIGFADYSKRPELGRPAGDYASP